MANLQLAVRAEYFHAMKRGEKKFEYRILNDYWRKRLVNREYDRLIITLGYPRKDDAERRIDVPYRGYKLQSITHKHFGTELVNVFAIRVEA